MNEFDTEEHKRGKERGDEKRGEKGGRKVERKARSSSWYIIHVFREKIIKHKCRLIKMIITCKLFHNNNYTLLLLL